MKSLKNLFLLLVSHNIDEVPSGRTVENNVVASLIFEPTVEQIEAMSSEVCRLKRCDSDSLDAAAMVLMKLVLEVDAPLGDQKYNNPICFTPTSSLSENTNGKIKTKVA